MEKIDTKFRKAIPIQKRVAITLWRLSTGNSFRSTAAVFGVGKSSAVDITKQFCKFIPKGSSIFIKFQRNERKNFYSFGKFSEICKTPQVIGAIDATHVEIIAPENSPIDYFCRKQKFTINTQAVVDGKLKFIDVSTGFPGSIHDARVLRASSIYHTAERYDKPTMDDTLNPLWPGCYVFSCSLWYRLVVVCFVKFYENIKKRGDILNNPLAFIENQPVKPFIIGDGAYSLSSWLLKPYSENGALTRSEIKYNKILSSARSVVESAFREP
ncbi:LOW QUALITY PROTEIN: uncharacterized protein LOC135693659 [Rhopilema esculentum]|uniref:LOW QUALITY PROTEIN: uncharacterized protein LOC135693659 n=1 Tax=Rhopilema esculentum TaxID=499914 RepID=UPI0031CEC156